MTIASTISLLYLILLVNSVRVHSVVKYLSYLQLGGTTYAIVFKLFIMEGNFLILL